ncbi:MAG: hypothetical protein WC516_04150 [Patescibacteria group bacterium]
METPSLYRPILRKSWLITKKFKSLWFFGIFATLVSSGGEYEIISRAVYNPSGGGFFNDIINSFRLGINNGLTMAGGHLWQNIWLSLTQNTQSMLTAIIILVAAVAVTLFIVWLTTVSQIGIIRNVALADKNKKISINEGISFGNANFWPVLLSNIVLRVILFALFWIIGKELLFLHKTGLWGIIAYYVSFILFVIITLLVSFIIKYQIYYLLLKKQSFIDSFKSAWKLFIKNWLISLEMALLMFLVYLVMAFISLFISAVLWALFFSIVPIYLSILPFAVKLALAGLSVVLSVVIAIFIASITTTFQWTGWTILFNKLDGGDEESKIARLSQQIQQIPDYLGKK